MRQSSKLTSQNSLVTNQRWTSIHFRVNSLSFPAVQHRKKWCENNLLEGAALSLVKNVDNIEEIKSCLLRHKITSERGKKKSNLSDINSL